MRSAISALIQSILLAMYSNTDGPQLKQSQSRSSVITTMCSMGVEPLHLTRGAFCKLQDRPSRPERILLIRLMIIRAKSSCFTNREHWDQVPRLLHHLGMCALVGMRPNPFDQAIFTLQNLIDLRRLGAGKGDSGFLQKRKQVGIVMARHQRHGQTPRISVISSQSSYSVDTTLRHWRRMRANETSTILDHL